MLEALIKSRSFTIADQAKAEPKAEAEKRVQDAKLDKEKEEAEVKV